MSLEANRSIPGIHFYPFLPNTFSAFQILFAHAYRNKIKFIGFQKLEAHYSFPTRGRKHFDHCWQVRYSNLKCGYISTRFYKILP